MWNQEEVCGHQSANLYTGVSVHVGKWNNPDSNKGKWHIAVRCGNDCERYYVDGSLTIEAVKKIGNRFAFAKLTALAAELAKLL